MILFEECLKKAKEITGGYLVAAFVDAYWVDIWSEDVMEKLSLKLEQLLELRIFNKEREIKLIRSDISKEFLMRDSSGYENKYDYIDEKQFLDMDTTYGKNRKKEVYTTGGGKFIFPKEKIEDAYLIVRHYVSKYEESGQARIYDWRLVDIQEDD